jgi:hypothetical protein
VKTYTQKISGAGYGPAGVVDQEIKINRSQDQITFAKATHPICFSKTELLILVD